MRTWRALSLIEVVWRLALLACIALGLCLQSHAQDVAAPGNVAPDSAAPDAPTMTFHAYTNTIELPVLVLSTARERLGPIDTTQFRMTLNSGRPFRPSHVRFEGDDPITLAVLVDGNAHRNDLLYDAPEGIAAMIKRSLHPQDHVVLYALDCGRVRHSLQLPTSSSELTHAVRLLLQHQPISPDHREDVAACKEPLHLWTSMAYVVRELSTQPGRRVMLVIADGHDGGSSIQWTSLKSFTTRQSVTIFALSSPTAQRPFTFSDVSDPMSAICEFSGGMRLWSHEQEEPEAMRDFIRLLRERYILDFPRPANAQAGLINVQVTLGKHLFFIRASGATFPLADAKVLADPLTVPTDPTRTPDVGTRRALQPH